MEKAGVIGLGPIGGGVATCLVRSGQLAAVYDIFPSAVDKWPTVPPVVSSNAELGRLSDTILVATSDADQAITALSGPDGVLSQARPGMNIVILSTVSLPDLERIRAVTDAAGVGLVDCGVTGGPYAAQGGLICLAGGDAGVLDAVMPVLKGFARSVTVMGGRGAGMAAKIARNVMVYGTTLAGYEATRLCRAAGIDIAKLTKVVEDSADTVGGPMMWMGRPLDPLTDAGEGALRAHILVQLEKDLKAALDLAKGFGLDMPVASLTLEKSRAVVGLEL